LHGSKLPAESWSKLQHLYVPFVCWSAGDELVDEAVTQGPMAIGPWVARVSTTSTSTALRECVLEPVPSRRHS
ncbi:hypothetical protein, partial [Roseimicrobium gellanilyticum]|uniref:hypothetical protein n=1 Tax=Roseimicrobium gellanilyticum TaxID=748857 RepID=UPI001B881FF3